MSSLFFAMREKCVTFAVQLSTNDYEYNEETDCGDTRHYAFCGCC